ncbi:hypothetical protein SAMN02910451_00669 [Butyrivibrio hungatei]|uniref:Uncharacterized protein n=1 Tax=Butyrivibrio hungatei TaxID=185008 RepID=A0A1G5BDK3_9FIRM|nr:hypothetical protein [Butyrivibrio hungatei]SCX88167.1 hypothetical protein SAMN02910451_00669 [Butyrivibrio hungatei]
MAKVEIDDSKRIAMYGEIRAMEGENLRTNKRSDKEMVDEIIKIIIKHAKVK